ncbi:hypothetical protein MUK42_35197 [Musa troglodytarum]|uniref:Uncharacterized protein n=1 Tax=Musa troglodytarum TaxID=320322 RepID=A0A9E7HTS7_9LILI|nr:hypothetical protein MUK42_35197 [Musa troglodytarum]
MAFPCPGGRLPRNLLWIMSDMKIATNKKLRQLQWHMRSALANDRLATTSMAHEVGTWIFSGTPPSHVSLILLWLYYRQQTNSSVE